MRPVIRIAVVARVLMLAALLAFAPACGAANWLRIFVASSGDYFAIDTESIEKQPPDRLRVWLMRMAAAPFDAGTGQASMAYSQNLVDCSEKSTAMQMSKTFDAGGKLLETKSFGASGDVLLPVTAGRLLDAMVKVACARAYGKPTIIPVDPRLRTSASWSLLTDTGKGRWYVADDQVRTFPARAPNYVLFPVREDPSPPRALPGAQQAATVLVQYTANCTDLTLMVVSLSYIHRTGVQILHVDVDLDTPDLAASAKPASGSVAEMAMRRACAVGFGTRSAGITPAPREKPDEGRDEPGMGSGTGWHVGNGLIVTAAHVVSDAKSISVIDQDRRQYKATVVQFDEKNDVAVISVGSAGQSWRAVTLARAPAPLGSRVMTIGFPLLPTLGTAPKVTSGEISSTEGMQNDPTLYQISAPIQPGNSGGPLFNMNGEVVGMVISKLSASYTLKTAGTLPENINYAVKLRYIEALLEEANRGVLPPRPAAPRREMRAEDLVGQNRDAVFIVLVTTAPKPRKER